MAPAILKLIGRLVPRIVPDRASMPAPPPPSVAWASVVQGCRAICAGIATSALGRVLACVAASCAFLAIGARIHVNTRPELFLSRSTLAYYAEENANRRKKMLQQPRRPSCLTLALEHAKSNPFIASTFGKRPSRYERAKLAVGTYTLLPVRVLGLVVLAGLAWLCASLALLGARDTPPGQPAARPLSRVRRALARPIRPLLRAMLFVMGFYYIRVRGRPARRARAPVVVCNHVTFIEPLALAWLVDGCFVAEAEYVQRTPLVCTVARALMTIAVDRTSPSSRTDVAAEIRARATDPAWAHGPAVCLFPEGTTTNGTCMIHFKLGAFAPGVPVQPVAVRYPHVHCDPSWVEAGLPLGALVRAILCQPVNHLELTFLPPYAPSADERKDARLFGDNVRRVMASALGVECTGHTLDDVALQREARQLRLPPQAAVVEMDTLGALFEADRAAVKKVLASFASLDHEGRGELTLDQWVAAVAAADTPGGAATPPPSSARAELESVFRLLDVDETGTLDFREYLLGTLLMNAGVAGGRHREDALRFAWLALAGSLEATLGREQVRRLLVLPGNEHSLSDTRAMQLFEDVDVNHDGRIEWAEFKAYSDTHPEVLQAFSQRMVTRTAAA